MANDTMNQSTAEKIASINAVMEQEEKKVDEIYKRIGKLYVALHASNYESSFRTMFEEITESENTIRSCRAQVREIRGVVCCDKCGHDVPKESAFCNVCGAAMPGHEVEDRSEKVQCSVCGKYVDNGISFCTFCGMPMMRISEQSPEEAAAAAQVEAEEAVVSAVEEAQAEEAITENAFEEKTIVREPEEPVYVAPEEPSVDDRHIGDVPAPVVPAPEPEAEVPTCTRCNNPLKPGSLFCTSCGQRVAEAAPAPEPVAVPEPAPATKQCPACGRELAAKARFCVSCGMRVD